MEQISDDGVDEVRLSLGQVSEACCVHTEFIVELVEEGIIDPIIAENSTWIFEGRCLKRIRTAQNLQKDLGLNLPGVAVALELLQEVELLRSRLGQMSQSHQQQNRL